MKLTRNTELAINLMRQLMESMKSSGFRLTKWISNDRRVISGRVWERILQALLKEQVVWDEGLHLPHTQHAYVHALDIEILSQATLFNCCWVFGEFKV